ncbi:MAG: T9SS type A sorting domain-containing protein [Bacteroidetes bacterium]|nr:T9SS type A sorting domain-containing protein [Bacteroidota bacterium]
MKQKYLLIVIFLIASRAVAQPGTLDTTFGEEGKVLSTTLLGLPYAAQSIIVEKDGDILVGSGEGTAFLLKQFLNNGYPDSAFGNAGETRTKFENYLDAYIISVSVTNDNKIIAAGIGDGGLGSHNSDILLARYFENGKLDSSFGTNGKVIGNFNLIEIISCMKITNEGKILVAGYCEAGEDGKDNCFLAQFNSDGSVDTNFGDSGKVITDVDSFYQSYINSIAITPDGGIIAAGSAKYIPNFKQDQMLLAKYTADGKPDTGFGNNGLVFTNVGPDADYAYAVAIQNDGRIVVGGVANYFALDSAAMAVVRYNIDGSLDQSFNNTGFLSIFFGTDNAVAKALVIQPGGNFILGGSKGPDYSSPPNYAAADFALASVTKDGKIDSSFGSNGVVTTDFSGNQDGCYALALQADGKIIAVGGSVDPNLQIGYIALARYNNDLTKKQIIFAKIRRWWLHHNGIMWDNVPGIKNYAIQRSGDGAHWSTVYSTSVNHSPLFGNNSQLTINNSPLSIHNYYNDATPLPGDNYYRLQTTSIDGAVSYSNVLAINNNNAIKISPNPAKNILHVEGLPKDKKVRLSVVDLTGTVKLQTIANTVSLYDINIASLHPGNYLLKIENGSEVLTKQFLKE